MWTDGTVHEMAPGAPLVTDPELIAFERARAAEAEAQDAAGEGSAEARFSCALRVDFLVALTFELNLWHWTTREVCSNTPPAHVSKFESRNAHFFSSFFPFLYLNLNSLTFALAPDLFLNISWLFFTIFLSPSNFSYIASLSLSFICSLYSLSH